MKDLLKSVRGFQWDDSNIHKNLDKHSVRPSEAEQIFFNEPLVVNSDPGHSLIEARYYALGQTDAGRLLFAAFTIRKELIRIISVRDMSRQERRIFQS
jgi:uncharacterized DUF497 family protein